MPVDPFLLIRRSPPLLGLARTARGLVRRIRRAWRRCLPGARRRPVWTEPVADWREARPDIMVPPGLAVADIRLVPAKRFSNRNLMFDGGPVWPDFENMPMVRHRAHGKCHDVNAHPGWRRGPRLNEPVIWGGRCFFHFGHLVAEHVSRLPPALYRHPEARVLFTLPPGKMIGEVPAFFWTVMAWLGLHPDRIGFVTSPCVAARLHVYPQAETLGLDPPEPWYLDLLDELPRLNRLERIESQALYVPRLGELARGNGASAGETALIAALRQAGVAILDCRRESIRRQMTLYAGAKLLIFAEGSAMHGRQLLGRVDQKILVLRRRPRSTLARAHLTPRCRELEYAPVIRGFARPLRRDGNEIGPRGIAFHDADKLLAILARHGIDLTPHWRPGDYRAAVRKDARAWREAVLKQRDIDGDRTEEHIRNEFNRIGLADL
ncbi:glycosyltransferase 61 family protein [Paracoccus simplex]|uniref:Glycosyltransferase 61 family protein n=1 Tax=Paracoccus simplex TaxID=2086346 RepID=A0ABV7S5P9_9RHOB